MNVQGNTDARVREWARRFVAVAKRDGWLRELRQEITRLDRERHSERCEARRKANQG